MTRGKNGGAINNLFPYGAPLSPGDNRFAISPSRGCHACFFSLPPSLPPLGFDRARFHFTTATKTIRQKKKEEGGRKREGKDRVSGRSARANDECAFIGPHLSRVVLVCTSRAAAMRWRSWVVDEKKKKYEGVGGRVEPEVEGGEERPRERI